MLSLGYSRYEASGVPEALLFGQPSAGGPPLFPLDRGWDVEAACHGPSRPFPSPEAQRAPGACEYQPTGDRTYNFWQKLPGDRLRLSNCYCYALDRFEGGWCFPGQGGGMGELLQNEMTCGGLAARAAADGAAPAPRSAAVGGPQPREGHYIALFLRPQEACDFPHCGPDFHLLRRDASGTWSHKAGETPATDRDANGAVITDPEAAALRGTYTQYCGYFHVVPPAMRVGTHAAAPDRATSGLQRWRAAGLAVEVAPLPYDPAGDVVDDAARRRGAEAMARLQRGEAAVEDRPASGQGGGGNGGQQEQQPQQRAQDQSSRKLLLRGA
ncbi:MAG: hypothetical protein J3K34DRAFT_523984 [Monoraphidium minutum]|nr:MAG: hypothetical protein J3K34DRAFT_523984 [Monoraphidium minutum]